MFAMRFIPLKQVKVKMLLPALILKTRMETPRVIELTSLSDLWIRITGPYILNQASLDHLNFELSGGITDCKL